MHRWNAYGDEFGYNHRLCFFLVDYGSSSDDDEVPILSYEWTGESLYDHSPIPLPPGISLLVMNIIR